jgi:hypothetical protein
MHQLAGSFIILLGGCSVCVVPPPPALSDTVFDDNQRNWVETYRRELRVALENDDLESLKFFFEELSAEKRRLKD